MPSDPSESVRETVRSGYRQIALAGVAQSGGGCCGGSPCDAENLASNLGYAAADLAILPDGANLGLSCGNPTAIASLQSGEVLLDLGSGGGFDVFLAGPKVGSTGRAIGVDMTPEMLARARRNVADYRLRTGLENVEFRLGEIEHLPVADVSVDVIISNCVINLSPDKPQVWREMFRVLRPGGRVSVSDMALLRPLPPAMASAAAALVGCIAGAVTPDETQAMMRAAGFEEIELAPSPAYVDAMTSSGDPLYQDLVALLPEGTSARDFVTSLAITARKNRA